MSGLNPAMAEEDFEPEMVKLPNGLSMGKYEVTQAQWQAVMGNNPSKFKGENLPVEQVSWNDIPIFIEKLNAKTGKNYRLPSEDEWLKACQAGKNTEYSGSDTADNVAWYDNNSGNTTHPVGSKANNGWGLYDMSGNVWEWTNTADAESGARVLRGGAFFGGDNDVRCAARRSRYPSDARSNFLGFRVVLSPSL